MRHLLFAALLAVCALLRLLHLGERPIMHDEALFTFYAFEQIYENLDYRYLPILHGPLHLLVQAGFWHVFTDTDYTMRLPMALFGIGGFFWIWSLRRWLGEVGTWVSLAFYSLSPGLVFFARFFREDGVFVFLALWIVASGAHWWHTRRPSWLASFLVANTLLFCNKESSLFVYFSVVTFFVLLVLGDGAQYLFERRSHTAAVLAACDDTPRMPAPWIGAAMLFTFVTLCLTRIFEGITYDSDVQAAIGHDFVLRDVRSIPLALGWMPDLDPSVAGALGTGAFWRVFYLALALGCLGFFALLRAAVDRRWGHRGVLESWWAMAYEARWVLIGVLPLCGALYLAIFTTLFQNPLGFFEIYKQTWAYWGGQHEWGRIGGPFHLHSVNLLVYELPVVLLVVGGWVYSLWRLRWTRTTALAFLLVAVAAAAFHKVTFSGLQALPPLENGVQLLEPQGLGIRYFIYLIAGCAAAWIVVTAFPSSGRAVGPLWMLGLAGFSILYFAQGFWRDFLASPLYKGGEPVRLSNRHVDGAGYLEVTLNMDGGWNLAYVMVLVFFAALVAWREIERGRAFHGFLTWWAVTSLGAASYAREAVPQVGIHAALPAILVAGVYAQRFWDSPRFVPWRGAAAAFLALSLLWNTKSTVQLNFKWGGDARERMAYSPTGPELRAHAREVVDYVNKSGWRRGIVPHPATGTEMEQWIAFYNDPGRQREPRVLVTAETAIWQLRWYLRDIGFEEFVPVQQAVDLDYDFLFIDPGQEDAVPGLREKYHVTYGRGRVFWTPDAVSVPVLLDIWLATIPKQYAASGTDVDLRLAESKSQWSLILRYFAFREVFDGPGRPYPAVSAGYYVFCRRKDLP
ncbi:MAG: glycosyltransferase family 39 protein [Candidatus Sumerlaeia bacterium]|nr:glycosyltransferase family 39 protein [Candidatus Sumerlaeia bacterium]